MEIVVGLGAAPALLQLACLVYLPETPRWLMRSGQSTSAREVLLRVYRQDRAVDQVLHSIDQQISEEEAAYKLSSGHKGRQNNSHWFFLLLQGWNDLCNVHSNRRALTIACFLQGFQQLCGFV